ncbi:hypothetical protein DAI22_05g111800 [Oryza sativa Japonica Group]|nr:hypothetical protein DAI22_05g111800 [Oryza sativa Japonica Group]
MDDDGDDLPLPVGAIRLRLVLPRLPSHAAGAGGSPPRVEAKDSLTIVARVPCAWVQHDHVLPHRSGRERVHELPATPRIDEINDDVKLATAPPSASAPLSTRPRVATPTAARAYFHLLTHRRGACLRPARRRRRVATRPTPPHCPFPASPRRPTRTRGLGKPASLRRPEHTATTREPPAAPPSGRARCCGW